MTDKQFFILKISLCVLAVFFAAALVAMLEVAR